MKKIVSILMLLLLTLVSQTAIAQQNGQQKDQEKDKSQGKSVKQLTKSFVDYIGKNNSNTSNLAQKRSSRPATVTRDSISVEDENSFEDEFSSFRKRAFREYESFRDEANAEYAEFMEKAWKWFTPSPAKPKPKDEEVPPVILDENEQEKPVESKPIVIKEAITPPVAEPQPKPVSPIPEQPSVVPAPKPVIPNISNIPQPVITPKVEPKPEPDVTPKEEPKTDPAPVTVPVPAPAPDEHYKTFTCFGTEMKVRFEDDQTFRIARLTEKEVASTWKKLATKDYNNLIRDCLLLRVEHQLSDWAYLHMLHNMGEACVGSGNEGVLLAAFVYCQSGYKMRLAFATDKLVLLYASKHFIYGHEYFWIDGEYYYPFKGEGKMQVCEASFPQEKALSLWVPTDQKFQVELTPERLLVSRRYEDVQAKISVNKNLIDFYETYPTSNLEENFMLRWVMYANTPMDETVKQQLYPQLREELKGYSELEAMERLLNWVQTGFVYEYDEKVWGDDRAFFAEETLYYPYCDCEDRSIMLSRLVRDLLGLKCVLVYYPGHLAMAVHFNEDVKGDYFELNGERFVVADPTFINARVGRTMTGMNSAEATVILLQ